MSSTVTFFPVDNGDMTLIQICNPLRSSILIDCNIRVAADNQSDSTPDVAKALRERLKVDGDGRPYVDVMLLSHPDKDHCSGFERHFWVGPVSDYADDDKEQTEKRIIIRQIWSSPMVFRRANRKEPLCSDAKAFKAEARRRVRVNQENGCSALDGDRILILGEDQNGKTDSLGPILIKEGESFSGINGQSSDFLTSHLLAPMAPQDDEKEEELSRNDSSVIINFDMAASQENTTQRSRFLTGGDAGVSIWERIRDNYSDDQLQYDLLQAPHHCSWRSLSHDSWSDCGEGAEVSEKARSALAQANSDAFIVSSSKPVKANDSDPPCTRAKREYQDILGSRGIFKCTGEVPNIKSPKPMVFETTKSGFKVLATTTVVTSATPPRAGYDL